MHSWMTRIIFRGGGNSVSSLRCIKAKRLRAHLRADANILFLSKCGALAVHYAERVAVASSECVGWLVNP